MGTTVRCEIRNYCRAGLYLTFAEPAARDAISSWLPGTPVRVAFSSAEAGRPSHFQLDGLVAHAAPTGLGLFVESMPDGVLRALHAAGAAGSRAEPTGQRAASLDPPQRQALQQECTSLFSNFLNLVLKDFFSKISAKLSEASDQVPSFLEQHRYHYGAQELMQQRAKIQEDFFAAIREGIHALGQGRKATDGGDMPDELSLIDEGEFEDWLNLSSIVNQIESDVDIARRLSEFERRYGALSGMPLDRRNNPFGPEMVCRTFQGSTRGLDFSNAMRAVVYKTFGSALAQHLPALCEQLERVLAPVDAILPQAKKEPRPARTAAPPAAVAEPGEAAAAGEKGKPKQDLAEIAEALLGLYKQNQPAISQDAAEYSLERLMSALNRPRGGSRDAGAAGGTDATYAGQAAAGGGAHGPGASRPNLMPVVGRLLQAYRGWPDGRTAAGQPAPAPIDRVGAGRPEVGLRDLLRVIDALPSVDWIGRGGLGSASFSEQLARAGEGMRIPLSYQQTLDTAASLFGRAVTESVGGSEIESLLKRLERPLLKLSLRDGGFLASPDHPARQVVDLLEQYAVAADDQGRFFDAKLQRFLYLLVERISAQADQDPGIYAAVRDNLGKLLGPIHQTRRLRVARLQEACEGRDRIRQARSRVGDALDARLGGRQVPEIVLRLLDSGWRQYLVLLEMRAGTRGEEWARALACLDRLLSWLGPTPPGAAEFQDQATALTNEIERQLASINVDAGQLNAFMDALTHALGSAGQGDRTLPAVPYVSPGRPAEAKAAGGQGEAGHAALLSRLRVGDWWYFLRDGKWLPMQLIWLSQPAGHCAFANRSATSKLELSLADLAQQLEGASVKAWGDQDRPLLERSEHALLDEGRQLLQQRAMQDPVTGLPNRKGFLQRLAQAAKQPEPDRAHMVSIIEFDQFRVIYHACGVEAGEALTRLLAEEVQSCAGPEGVVASFRDDTLALFLPNCSRSQGCGTADRLLQRLKDYRYQHGEHSYSIGLNIGITEYAPELHGPEEAVRRADSACVAARTQGRNRMQVYEQDSLQLRTQESLIDWAGRIDSLLKGSGLYLRGQMVMPIGADASLLPYFEILLGIQVGPGQEVKPMTFIPAVERLQRAHEVDLWVMRRVFEWIRGNRAGFAAMGGFSINLSALSLSNPEIIAFLRETLPQDDIPTDKIIFEITETAAIESYAAAQEFIRQIRRYGCKFSLDDFGSGYTSYAHLKNLHTDSLKIDGSFVKDMVQSPSDYAMVKSMNDIGHSLGMRTVAEYVESPMILAKLREIGVDYAQGYAIHKPCPIDQILPDALA